MMRGADAYRRTEAQSATPLQLVVMLYDGALRFLAEARSAQQAGDIATRARAVRKVSAIIAECQSTLNLETGGAVAVKLDGLYTYISARLIDITVKKDATAIDEVARLVATLREAWSQAATQSTQEPVGAGK
jgi:flagellar secretion chaperone FliS